MVIIKNILVIGSLNMDFVIEVNKMPLPGETIKGNSFSLVPGGKGANEAYALGKLGTNVTMLGAVGNDEYGEKLINNLRSVNVNVDNIIKLDDINTGCAFINVDKTGENNIVVISGANEKVSEETIDKNISLIENSDIIVLQLEIPINVVTYAAKLAKQKGKIVILDPAPAINNLPEDLLKNVDIIKPNETEIQIITGLDVESDEEIINAAKILLNKGVKNVIVTLGEKGSILVTENYSNKFSTYKVKAIDTTAAGDTFTAALAKSLLENNNLEDAIKFGHLVSSIVVTKKGAQTSIPSKDEIENFINMEDFKWKE